LNVGVTVSAAVIITLQELVPEQAPLQPAKVKLPLALAVSVTFVPLAKVAVQVVGQLMPAGALVIVPAPDGGAVTVNW
jgi:hypothetical protein